MDLKHRLALLLGSKAAFRNGIKPEYYTPGFFFVSLLFSQTESPVTPLASDSLCNQDNLDLLIFLLPPRCWDYRHVATVTDFIMC